MTSATATARSILAAKSKSFALAGRLLGAAERDRAAIVYAYCRQADDAIDEAAPGQAARALSDLHRQLDIIYSGQPVGDPICDAFAEVVRDCAIPRQYPDELLAGMAMDTDGYLYSDRDDLLLYCYRVAGVVGLMMCHVLGLRDDRALLPAVHLGLGMQLTNICRDVAEDWQRARLYLPADMLAAFGAANLHEKLGSPLPETARQPVARVTRELLALADGYYRSADRGMTDLPWRASFAIRTARMVYAAIGDQVARQGHDPRAPRAVVPRAAKLRMVVRAGKHALADLRHLPRIQPRIPGRKLRFGPDVVSL